MEMQLTSCDDETNRHVRRAMGGIQSWYLIIFIAYLMHYTYMSRFSENLRKAAFAVAVGCVALPLGIFIPMRAPTAGGDVAAGVFMIWTVLGLFTYAWLVNFDQKLEDNYEYSIRVKETKKLLMAGDQPDIAHNHITTFYTEDEEVLQDGYSRFHLEQESDGSWCVCVSASDRWWYCNDATAEDKLLYTADGTYTCMKATKYLLVCIILTHIDIFSLLYSLMQAMNGMTITCVSSLRNKRIIHIAFAAKPATDTYIVMNTEMPYCPQEHRV